MPLNRASLKRCINNKEVNGEPTLPASLIKAIQDTIQLPRSIMEEHGSHHYEMQNVEDLSLTPQEEQHLLLLLLSVPAIERQEHYRQFLFECVQDIVFPGQANIENKIEDLIRGLRDYNLFDQDLALALKHIKLVIPQKTIDSPYMNCLLICADKKLKVRDASVSLHRLFLQLSEKNSLSSDMVNLIVSSARELTSDHERDIIFSSLFDAFKSNLPNDCLINKTDLTILFQHQREHFSLVTQLLAFFKQRNIETNTLDDALITRMSSKKIIPAAEIMLNTKAYKDLSAREDILKSLEHLLKSIPDERARSSVSDFFALSSYHRNLHGKSAASSSHTP